jgi:PAS domain S-box-containing protein
MSNQNCEAFLRGGGEMGERIRALDWSKTAIGPVSSWSPALRSTVALLLQNRFPLILWWGPRFVQFYNDTYIPIPGEKHPKALGQPANECWAEIWHVIGPMIEAPFSGQPATVSDDLFLLMNRKGFIEETHFKVAYSPVPDDTVQPTGVGGVLATVAETTEQVYGERQLRTLRELGARASEAKTSDQACQTAAVTFTENSYDVPFALFYLMEPGGKQGRLAASAGFTSTGPANPSSIDIDSATPWPLKSVVGQGKINIISDLAQKFSPLPRGAWSESPNKAIVLPLTSPDQPYAYGVLIAGLNPHRDLNEGYRTFFELAASQVTTAIRNANAFQEEKKRAEALEEIDRAKTTFFSNVSHEFRTPLTLMLSPLEDLISGAKEKLPAEEIEKLSLIHSNGLRLLKLVNNLLDFSRIEAGRIQAIYEPADLADYTAELAGVFRSAIEKAGLKFNVDCPPLPQPVYIDKEMWEKMVLNLLSNAFKFTFEGEIAVSLQWRGDHVELEVKDTGIGIAPEEMPHLFERFYRIQGARARTHEGTGIGLALVQELARLHGGKVQAVSDPGQGTTFTVSIPTGSTHLPKERIGAARTLASTAMGANSFVEEALKWLPEELASDRNNRLARDKAQEPVSSDSQSKTPKVLVVDDNADMRHYIQGLLSRYYEVEVAADGRAALESVRKSPPDLVMTDIMMPVMDGFELLRALRDNPDTKLLPIILLSARAGEEARVEGLDKGADDYLIKPFNASELISRVRTHLELSLMRKKAEEALSQSEERYRTLFESMAEGFVAGYMIYDSQGQAYDYQLTEANSAYERLTGMPQIASLHKTIKELIPTLEPTWIEHHARVVETGNPERWEAYNAQVGQFYEIYTFSPKQGVFASIFSNITERKKSEKSLRESEARLRLAQNAARMVAWEYDPVTMKINFSENAEEVLEIPRRFESSDQGYSIIHPEDVERHRALVTKAIETGGSYVSAYRHAHSEQTIWLEEVGQAVTNESGRTTRLVGITRNITERKKAEEELSQRENRFRILIENLRSGVALIDEQGHFNTVNSEFLKMFGLSPESTILNVNSQDWSAWQVYEEDGKTLLNVDEHPVRKATLAGQPVRNKLVGVRLPSGGDLIWMIVNADLVLKPDGNIQYVIATYYDITDRKKAEESLKTNIESLRILSEANSLLLSTADPGKTVQAIANRVMIHLNCDCFFNFIADESAGKLRLNAYAGIPEETARGIEWLEYGVAICGCAARDGCRIVSEDIQESGDMRAALVRSFGVQAYACHPLTIGPKTIGTLSFGTRSRTSFTENELDLMKTIAGQVSVAMERSRNEQSLKRYTVELESANKELESFAYSVSHDLRTPLRTLDGFSEMVIMEYGDKLDETGKDYLNRIRKASQHMSQITEDILKLSRITRAEMHKGQVNLSEMTASIAEELKEHQPERQAEFIIVPDLIVNGDKALLEILLRNLLDNAWKYSGKCPDTRIEVGANRRDGKMVYFIKDNGVGFDMKYYDKLFQPFQRLHTSKDYPGTGIGLATAARVIHRHSGKIWAESEIGKGTTFYFTLE